MQSLSLRGGNSQAAALQEESSARHVDRTEAQKWDTP